MIGLCVRMNSVPHVVLAWATDEQLHALVISNVFHRSWLLLLNLETGKTDVWPERDVRDSLYIGGCL